MTKILYEHCSSFLWCLKKTTGCRIAEGSQGEERKHEKGKERIILPLYIKLSDDYPTVILTKEPAGWRGNGAGWRVRNLCIIQTCSGKLHNLSEPQCFSCLNGGKYTHSPHLLRLFQVSNEIIHAKRICTISYSHLYLRRGTLVYITTFCLPIKTSGWEINKNIPFLFLNSHTAYFPAFNHWHLLENIFFSNNCLLLEVSTSTLVLLLQPGSNIASYPRPDYTWYEGKGHTVGFKIISMVSSIMGI